MDINQEEGFVDLTLRLEEFQRQADGTQSLIARGEHEGRSLGLLIRLAPEWEKGSFAGTTTWRTSITLESLGEESDAFLIVLSGLYGQPLSSARMAAQTKLIAVSLKGNPSDLSQGPVKMKLFHEPETDAVDENAIDAIYAEQYFEVYLNFDLAAGQVEFNEKDEGYREPLLRILSAGSLASNAAPEKPWNFSCEKRTELPLPPEESFEKLFAHLDPAKNSFFILEAPNGDYIQCGGSHERCAVEVRYWEEGSQNQRYSHFNIGRKSGGSADTAVKMSGGEITVKENEVLTSAEAIELFEAFYAGGEFPGHFILRQAQI